VVICSARGYVGAACALAVSACRGGWCGFRQAVCWQWVPSHAADTRVPQRPVNDVAVREWFGRTAGESHQGRGEGSQTYTGVVHGVGRWRSVGLTTVYRTLQQMAGDGLVDTVRTETGEVMYRWCSQGLHHHLVCRRCRSAVEIAATHVEQWATHVAREYGSTCGPLWAPMAGRW
jgi:hypothetical protein